MILLQDKIEFNKIMLHNDIYNIVFDIDRIFSWLSLIIISQKILSR